MNLHASDPFPEAAQLPARPEFPDPLMMLNGDRVATKDQWIKQRRPELEALFGHYMYGVMPPPPNGLQFKIEKTVEKFLSGKASMKEVSIHIDQAEDAPVIHLLVITPRSKSGPFPVFVGLNFSGNHTIVANTNVSLPTAWVPKSAPGAVNNHSTDAGRGAEKAGWDVGQIIDRGYALAAFYCGDAEPDDPEATTGLRAWYARKDYKKPAPDWGAIAAWAWGASRAVDYLITDKSIDPARIAVVGHSRLGKASLLAAAFDERIAMAVPLQAGCGGTAPSRGKIGESVKAINTSFPHWFNAEFKMFNDQPERLPFDQNCLIAMVAPRPVLIGCAVEDTWSNPGGQFAMLQSADTVYRLLGAGGLDAKQMPETNELSGGTLGYFIRPGKHSMTSGDWKVFLDYADQHLRK